jgi:hypothetical protein
MRQKPRPDLSRKIDIFSAQQQEGNMLKITPTISRSTRRPRNLDIYYSTYHGENKHRSLM